MVNYYYICGAETRHNLCESTTDIGGVPFPTYTPRSYVLFLQKQMGASLSFVHTN